MSPSLVLAATLETAFGQLLAMDPGARARLPTLGGATIAVEVIGPGITLYLLPGSHDIQVVDEYNGLPEVIVRGSPAAFVLLARGRTPQEADIEILGDPGPGKALQALLHGLDIDWEEQLSRWVGDFAAYRIGALVRDLLGFGRAARDTLLLDAGEVLHEEYGWLPTRTAVEGFLAEVDRARSGADRLEARLARLERALKPQ